MRIAFVTAGYSPDLGGIELVVGQMARRLVVAGHAVEVFAHSGPLAPPGSEVRDGVIVRRFRVPLPSHDFAVSPRLFAALARRNHDFDVVHVHNYHASPPLAAALADMRPLILSPYYHGGGHNRAAKIAHIVYRPMSFLLFRACSHIVCVSGAEARALKRDFSYLKAPVSVVPSGVDREAFAAAVPFDTKSEVVVAAGRTEPYKQFDRIALAANGLPTATDVVFLGDGPGRVALEQTIVQHGLSERVRCLGRVPDGDLRRWFRTAKVLVTMSRHESFGMTLVEALAAGTPVVASDIPPHREIAERYPHGAVRLVSVDAAPAELAEAISRAKREGLPAGLQTRSWDDVMEEVLAIYAAVAA